VGGTLDTKGLIKSWDWWCTKGKGKVNRFYRLVVNGHSWRLMAVTLLSLYKSHVMILCLPSSASSGPPVMTKSWHGIPQIWRLLRFRVKREMWDGNEIQKTIKIHFIIPFTNHIIQKLYQELRILQITVYYKELLTINCQGTNHPRSILSFMDITG